MLIEIPEERSYLGIKVGGSEAKGEERPANRLQCIRLDDGPLLNRFGLLLGLQEETDLVGLRDCPVESSYLKYLKLIATGKLLLGWRENRAILKRIHQTLQFTISLWREEDKGVSRTEQYDEFAELGVQEAIIEHLLPREAEEEPVEEERGAGMLPAIQSGHQQQSVQRLSLHDAFQFLPTEEEVLRGIAGCLRSLAL
jgi:hypothetical protein